LQDPAFSSIVVTEGPDADSAIARRPSAVTAFIGRTLRGPVNRPVSIYSFAEFHNMFGGLWQQSTLSYAVEQFFDNGGRHAVIVRVVNGGAPATITLPCGEESLTLAALSPGSREALRASVDYDNVGSNEPERFNLVVQRVRTRGSERIEDQEIFRRLSIVPGTARFITTALQDSGLVRVRGTVPAVRPDQTFLPGSRHPIGYVDSNPDGDDGQPLTDYDVIGSPASGAGLFALARVEDLQFVCIPPLTRERDLGPGTLMVAAQLCRRWRAMLVVDPPAAWESCGDVVRGLRELDFRSEHALMCFPRIVAFDRLRGRPETFANCGAVAGTLSRLDAQRSPYDPGADDELLLRLGTRPLRVLTDPERQRLAAHGVNPLQALRSAVPRPLPLRTLAGGSASSSEGMLLTAQRRRLLIMNSIEAGTRWVLFAAPERAMWQKLEKQVQAFLQPLADAGAFGAPDEGGTYQVACDERLNPPEQVAAGRVHLMVSLRNARSGSWWSFVVTHGREGSEVRPVQSSWIPKGTRMTVAEVEVPRPDANEEPVRPRPAPLSHDSYYHEPRPAPSAVVRNRAPVAAPAGGLDAEAIARIHRELGGGWQRF
jgi:phage tail sheath protein FI